MTFNHHEAYLCALAQTGHEFFVVTKYRNLNLNWNKAQQPVPPNMQLCEWDKNLETKIEANFFDVIICHTIKNLFWLWRYKNAKFIFIAHIPLFTYTLPLKFKSFCKKMLFRCFRKTHNVHFHAVSEFKRQSWGEVGSVAVLAPQKRLAPQSGEGYGQIILVANEIEKRKDELGYPLLEYVVNQGLPLKIIGNNVGAPYFVKPIDFADFQRQMASGRIYLYTISQPYGDGYNTAMLEAMSLGMAIVTVENPSSPIVHGKNGLVVKSKTELVDALKKLLNDRALVDRLGTAAKQTIAENFSTKLFLKNWQEMFRDVRTIPELSN